MTHDDGHKQTLKERREKALQPDPETLNTTDPQEHMKGPISNWMHHIEHNAEKADYETPPPPDEDDAGVAEKKD